MTIFYSITDFGVGSPYVGQLHARLVDSVPTTPFVELISDLPPFQPKLATYLIPALVRDLPVGGIFICVVDPGVGGERDILAMRADDNWFVGPDNGLLAILSRRSDACQVWRSDWKPKGRASPSFHGRDLMAPLAARIAKGESVPGVSIEETSLVGVDWPDDLAQIIYTDHYGNLLTGWRAEVIDPTQVILVGDQRLSHARTFSAVEEGQAFWYENSLGLVELAINQGRADEVLGLAVGDRVSVSASLSK